MAEYNWPYPDEFGQTETVDSDILVLGGGPREAERQEQDLTTGNPPVRTRVLR